MPFPGAIAFPSSALFPGTPRVVFHPPTQDLAFPMEGHLIALLPHGLSVWRVGGVWAEGFAPHPDVVAAADRFYRGGYVHDITDDEIEELIAAGYADRLTTEDQ